MTKLITIAGPQSSGKTTALKIINKHFPNINIFEETNQYNVHSKNHAGAAFVTPEMEMEIVDMDIEKIRSINRNLKAAVIETGIFQMIYLERFIGEKAVEKYYPRYLAAHQDLVPIIIFIDTKAHVSWRRRKKIYEARVRKQKIVDKAEKHKFMEKYKKTILELYPRWIKWFERLPFKKIKVKNSYKSIADFEAELFKVFRELIV